MKSKWLVFIFITGFVTVFCALIGLYKTESALGQSFDFGMALRLFARTAGYFFANEPNIDNPHWAAVLAQLLGPFVTAGALWTLLGQLVADFRTRRRVRSMSGHTIVLGVNASALAFAKSERVTQSNRKQSVVLVAERIEDSHKTTAALHEFDLLDGDPSDGDTLVDCGVLKAKRLIVIADKDDTNIDIAMLAMRISEGRDPLLTKLEIYVSVRHRLLWGQLARSDAIVRQNPHSELRPFNLATWSARLFTWNEPLWRYALLREQQKIHVVFMGYEDFSAALLGQLPAAYLHDKLGKICCTILTPNRGATERKIERSYPQISETMDVTVIDFELETAGLDEPIMLQVASRADVTAVFVCRDDSDAGLGTAINVRDSMSRHNLWNAPVYVRLSWCSRVREILKSSLEASSYTDVLQPFGVEEELCDLSTIDGWLEKCAEDFHRDYKSVQERDSVHVDSESIHAWEKLPETYRQANRRAADHIPAKLSSLGCFISNKVVTNAPINGLLKSSSVPDFGGRLDALSDFTLVQSDANEFIAELEHESWNMGRFIDGWRYGAVRNNERRLQPHLIKYSELTEDVNKYDRVSANKLYNFILKKNHKKDLPKIRKEVRIGLIGKNAITAAEAKEIRQQLNTKILPEVISTYPEAHFTLLTPLAPGSDFVLTQSCLEQLATNQISHGLIVLESVPEKAMIDDWEPNFKAGCSWDGRLTSESSTWRKSSAIESNATSVFEAIRAGREQLADARVPQGEDGDTTGSTQHFFFECWTIDLTSRNIDYDLDEDARIVGYEASNAYIGRNADMMITVLRSNETSMRRGGTRDALRRIEEKHPDIDIKKIEL